MAVNPFLDWRRASREVRTHEVVKGVSPELLRRIELIESQNLQTMQALQAVLQTLEDERAKREMMDNVLTSWAAEARRAG